MKIYRLSAFLFAAFLFSCAPETSSEPVIKEKEYVFYMYNCPSSGVTSFYGNPIREENPIYLKEEIVLDSLLVAPEDPKRANYEFQGWYKEKKCENIWDFSMDKPNKSLYLYAKWGQSQSEEYIEPEYHYPETILTDRDYEIEDILNQKVLSSSVSLTEGGIQRLEANASDVRFAIHFAHKEGVSLEEATYDKDNQRISLRISNGESKTIQVQDITSSLELTDYSYYETKAKNYEKNGADIENYHVALGGSSSMENWATSSEDLAPIVSFNHGIGGTTVEQWTNSLLERLLVPYCPKVVTYYVGVNNIINGDREKGDAVGNKLIALFDKTHAFLPHAKIFYVLINRLPNFMQYQNEFDAANQMALDYASSHPYLSCIDAGANLVKPNGLPDWAYFLSDGLHMSQYGYRIWGEAVKKAIQDYLG